MDQVKEYRKRQFNALKRKIDDACEIAGFDEGLKRFFANKIARKLKQFKSDIYDVNISHKPFVDDRRYSCYLKINAKHGSLFVRITVD